MKLDLAHPVGHFLPLANGENAVPDGPDRIQGKLRSCQTHQYCEYSKGTSRYYS
jgi:hypothetical protein